MRLVFLIAGLVAIILTSRWLTLSENSPFAKKEDDKILEPVAAVEPERVPEGEFGTRLPAPVVQSPALVADAEVVSFESDEELDHTSSLSKEAALNQPQPAKHVGEFADLDSSSSCPRFKFTHSGNAKNVQRLVRAEYEMPTHIAEVLVKLDSEPMIDATLIDSGSRGTATLRITAGAKTQQAFCELLMALNPTVQNCHLPENNDENEIDEYEVDYESYCR